MQQHWFNEEWVQLKDSGLITPASFDPNFGRRISAVKMPDSKGADIAFPIDRVGQLDDIVEGRDAGHFYARFGSEQTDALNKALVMAEAGYLQDNGVNPTQVIGATVFPSGMSAIFTLVYELIRHIPTEQREGMRFIQGDTVYHSTNHVLSERAQEFGLEKAFRVDTTNPENVERALEENKGKIVAIYYEPVTNPEIKFTNTREISRIAKRHNVPVIVDNTFLTPYLQQPFRQGADIVVHSLTKYISGFGDMLGGAVIGPKELIASIKELQRDTGAVMQSPDMARIIYHRLQDLSNRMPEHTRNAAEIANYLRQVEFVGNVYFPNLGSHTRGGSPGAVLSFDIKPEHVGQEREHVKRFLQFMVDNPGTVNYKVSMGEYEHLMIDEPDHGKGFIRFSIGRHPSAKEVTKFLDKAFNHAYKR